MVEVIIEKNKPATVFTSFPLTVLSMYAEVKEKTQGREQNRLLAVMSPDSKVHERVKQRRRSPLRQRWVSLGESPSFCMSYIIKAWHRM